jgi:hypothetical protein
MFLRFTTAQQDVSIPDHDVKRISQFVGKRGQKFVFEAVRLFSLAAGVAFGIQQFGALFFGQLALTNIRRHTDHADQFVLVIKDRRVRNLRSNSKNPRI